MELKKVTRLSAYGNKMGRSHKVTMELLRDDGTRFFLSQSNKEVDPTQTFMVEVSVEGKLVASGTAKLFYGGTRAFVEGEYLEMTDVCLSMLYLPYQDFVE